MISNKLKEIIFKKLYSDLKDVEIIPYGNSIFFINRENRYWYLEYEKNGTLYWRYGFFEDFFSLFSMESREYIGIISQWAEEVLNHRVSTTYTKVKPNLTKVEEILNHKVSTTIQKVLFCDYEVEEVLNCKVSITMQTHSKKKLQVEKVLNHKVLSNLPLSSSIVDNMDEILNGSNV